MNNIIEENMAMCITEFYELCQKDEYISKKTFEQFVYKYQDVFKNFSKYVDKNSSIYKKMIIISQEGYNALTKHNHVYLNKKLKEYKDYFDNMFISINKNVFLNEEQRKAILVDEDYSFLVVDDKSGKITLALAKTKYLVEIKKINPKDIIVLALTDKVAEELNNRLNVEFNLGVEVITFKNLSVDLVEKVEKENIIDYYNQYAMCATYIKNKIFPNKRLLKTLLEVFNHELQFDDNCFNYKTFDEYWQYYSNLMYEQNKDKLSKVIAKEVKKRSRYKKTINGEYVKSEGEVKIANYLYRQGIDYIYNDHIASLYEPDFKINYDNRSIYIQYYNFAKYYKNGNIKTHDGDYKNNIYLNRKHMRNQLIELFGDYGYKTTYISRLSEELSKMEVLKQKRTDDDIFRQLMKTGEDVLYEKFLHIVIIFISLFKEQNYQEADFDNLIQSISDKKMQKQLEIIRSFYRQYTIDLNAQNKIDLADLLNLIDKNKEKIANEYKLNYKYAIISEYQNIQNDSFAKKIYDLINAKIVGIGTDVKNIFAFSETNIELFTQFYKVMDYDKFVKVAKTYRESKKILSLTDDIINTQVDDKYLYKPLEIVEYNRDVKMDLTKRLKEVVLKIYRKNKNAKVLILGRNPKDINKLILSNYFKKDVHNKVVLKEAQEMYIDFLSIDNINKLDYDYVFLLNIIDDYPNRVMEHEIIKLLYNKESEDSFERLLFYIGLMKTKTRLYIMCSKQVRWQSKFLKDILNNAI